MAIKLVALSQQLVATPPSLQSTKTVQSAKKGRKFERKICKTSQKGANSINSRLLKAGMSYVYMHASQFLFQDHV